MSPGVCKSLECRRDRGFEWDDLGRWNFLLIVTENVQNLFMKNILHTSIDRKGSPDGVTSVNIPNGEWIGHILSFTFL